ncbi:MAG: gluconate 2-dehydrogenase subunit 3 family protein [Allosphingosinicella sp.]
MAGGAAAALGALPFLIGDATEWMTPNEARHRGLPLRSFDAEQAALLARLGEVLLPGADEAGFVHFIDHHVSVPAPESLLMLRYMDVPPPYADFYRAGLAALDAQARAAHGDGFAALPFEAARAVVGDVARAQPRGWHGPPSQLFYFVARSDAVDVVYGTMEGFERLGLPYLAHLEPQQPW